MSVSFDIYNKQSFFKRRVKVIYEGRDAFIPREQFEIFKELSVVHPEISKELKRDGNIFIESVKSDAEIMVRWESNIIAFTVRRTNKNTLGIFNLHG